MEIKLSDTLLEQIDSLSKSSNPEGTVTRVLDFDEKGTVHIMNRDGDGKLLKDTPIRMLHVVGDEGSLYDDAMEEYRKKQDHNEHVRKWLKVFYACLIFLCVAVFVFYIKMR